MAEDYPGHIGATPATIYLVTAKLAPAWRPERSFRMFSNPPARRELADLHFYMLRAVVRSRLRLILKLEARDAPVKGRAAYFAPPTISIQAPRSPSRQA